VVVIGCSLGDGVDDLGRVDRCLAGGIGQAAG
jgi:hypothetical protein